MSLELIRQALSQGAALYASISGGKDGQAMVSVLTRNQIPITGMIHAHLGRIEWPESMEMCRSLSERTGVPLHVVQRADGMGLVEIWKRRMEKVASRNIPFWSSSKMRYCTSDLKLQPIYRFFTSTGHSLIINAQGIRASESRSRAKKDPVAVCYKKSSIRYRGLSVEDALAAYLPSHKLVIDWYPIFNYSVAQVWQTGGMTDEKLAIARQIFKETSTVPSWWTFHPAYVYGNQRVSCRYCVLACLGDLMNAARMDQDGLIQELAGMERESGFTFKDGFALSDLLTETTIKVRRRSKRRKVRIAMPELPFLYV